MKKYTLFVLLSVFVLSLFIINTSPASAANCAPGDLFSSVTGQRCAEVSTSVDVSTYSDLKIGSRGESVRMFQQILKDAGFSVGKIDGIYGRMTDAASKNYYKKYPPVLPICPLTANSEGTVSHYCPPVSTNPVISGVSGPQKLNINEQGTWTVKAYDPNGGNLSYYVDWGDQLYMLDSNTSGSARMTQQSATFTHSYATSGNYTATFTVVSENTIRCITYPCPTNGGTATTSLTVSVGNVTPPSNYTVTVLAPNGKETWVKGTTQTIKWQDTTPVKLCLNCGNQYDITLKPICVEVCTAVYRPDFTIAKNVKSNSYSWSVGKVIPNNPASDILEYDSAPDGTYLIQVCQSGTDICDSSDSYFKIVGGSTTSSITVISPNGGENWVKGTTKIISYQDTNNISTHEIKLVPYYPSCTTKICPAYPFHAPYTIANTQALSYSWNVGQTWETSSVPNGKYTIQVCQTGTTTCDSSDNYFNITSGTIATTPTISYLSPASGGVGTQVKIYGSGFSNTCIATGNDYCRIALLSNTIYFGSSMISNVAYSDYGDMLSFTVPAEITGGGVCYSVGNSETCSPVYVVPVTSGNYTVSVKNANGTSNTVYFTVK